MALKISEDKIKRIPVLYAELKNKSEVARRLEISVASVNKYLTLANAAPISEKKPKTIITPELIEQINKEYPKTKNMSEVARKLGISVNTVKKYLSEDNIVLSKTINDDRDALWYFIYKLFGPEPNGEPVSKWNMTQMTKFKNQGMPYQGQLLTLKYFFEVQHNPINKANRSIGIIPFVYDEAKMYYTKIEARQKEIGEMIKRQLEKDRIEIKYSPSDYMSNKKKKKMIDLDSI